MITFEEFNERLDEIKQIEKDDLDLDAALKRVAPSDFTGFARPNYLEEKLGYLIDDMGDKYDYISWWLWETPNEGKADDSSCTVWSKDDNKKWVLKTRKDLYDFLVEHYEGDTEDDVAEYIYEGLARRAQTDGVRFAINTILELRHNNKNSNNPGAEEREALLRYVCEKISNEYAIKTGIFVEEYANEEIRLFSNEEE